MNNLLISSFLPAVESRSPRARELASAFAAMQWHVNTCKYSRVRIDGTWINATNDIGTTPGEFYFDYRFLMSLSPDFHSKFARTTLERSEPLINQVQMEIVGIVSNVPLAAYFDAADEGTGAARQEIVAEQVFVVRELPVPLHIAYKHLKPDCVVGDERYWPTSAAFGPPYSDHAYWRSDTNAAEPEDEIDDSILRETLFLIPRPRDMLLCVFGIALGAAAIVGLMIISGEDRGREL